MIQNAPCTATLYTLQKESPYSFPFRWDVFLISPHGMYFSPLPLGEGQGEGSFVTL